MRIHPAITEKDFWVCWMLDYLFSESPWKDHLAFKGGTSLSKAYGLIERFSEDIDLVLDWRLLGYGDEEMMEARSATQQDRLGKEANRKAALYLSEAMAPALRATLPERVYGEFDVVAQGENLLIRYPKAFALNAIQPEIRLEIGPIAAWRPQAIREIRPYAAEHFPHAFRQVATHVPTLAAERTFWEKATILHQEAHRDATKPVPSRYSRHYYDLHRMHVSPIGALALKRLDLLSDVVAFKKQFYRSAWANFDAAKPGTLRLIPPAASRKSLMEDYHAMRAMLFGSVPTFEAIENGIAELETHINTQ